MKQRKFMGVSLAAMVVLAGCVDPNTMTEEEKEVLRGNSIVAGTMGSGSVDFGNATRANMATHIVDPAPAYAADAPKIDGQIILGAYGRYRTNKVSTASVGGITE